MNQISQFQRIEGSFKGFDNKVLYYQEWIPLNHGNDVPEPKGVIIITHGQGEHSECYQRLVQGLRNSGWTFCAWDWRGHGRSEGKRGYASNFIDYCKDYECFLNFLRSQKKMADKQWVLAGHSMGGLIQLRTLHEILNRKQGAEGVTGDAPAVPADLPLTYSNNYPIVGQVLSAPLLGLTVKVPLVKDLAAIVFNNIYPRITLWNELKDTQMSRDPGVLQEFAKDTLRHDQLSPGVYLGFIRAIALMQAEASKYTLPTLMQLGGKDSVVSTPAARDFFDKMSSRIKRRVIYPESLHEIYNDLDRENAFHDIQDFLKPLAA